MKNQRNRNQILTITTSSILSTLLAATIGLGVLSAQAAPASESSQPEVSQKLAQKAAPKKPATGVTPNTKNTAKPAAKPTAAKDKKEVLPPDSAYTQLSPTELLTDPGKHQNQYVEFVGVFNRFSDTGLDYKKAFRDSRDYVSLFILRPEVEPHQIPLSELKLFFPRKKSEEVINLEGGDTVRIRGKVFSIALNEPWVDVLDVKILQKTKESTKKPNEEL